MKCRCLTLKGEEVKRVQNIECKCGAWTLDGCREPPSTKELNTGMRSTYRCVASAKLDIHQMNTARIHDYEVVVSVTRECAGGTVMA
jgi:hypothetical protein